MVGVNDAVVSADAMHMHHMIKHPTNRYICGFLLLLDVLQRAFMTTSELLQQLLFALPQDVSYLPSQILPAFRRTRSALVISWVIAIDSASQCPRILHVSQIGRPMKYEQALWFQMTRCPIMATSTTAHACEMGTSDQFKHLYYLHCASRSTISSTCRSAISIFARANVGSGSWA